MMLLRSAGSDVQVASLSLQSKAGTRNFSLSMLPISGAGEISRNLMTLSSYYKVSIINGNNHAMTEGGKYIEVGKNLEKELEITGISNRISFLTQTEELPSISYFSLIFVKA